MNPFASVIELQISEIEKKVAALRAAGKETALEAAKLSLMKAQLATSNGVFRVGLFEESGGEDRYSLQRGIASLEASERQYAEAVRTLRQLDRDPHADVLREVGLGDSQ